MKMKLRLRPAGHRTRSIPPVSAFSLLQPQASMIEVGTSAGWLHRPAPGTMIEYYKMISEKPPWKRAGARFKDETHYHSILNLVGERDESDIAESADAPSERDALRKFTILSSVKRPNWTLDPFEPVIPDPIAVAEGIALLTSFLSSVKRAPSLGPGAVSDPLDTMVGAPSHASGFDARVELVNRAEGLFDMSRSTGRVTPVSGIDVPEPIASKWRRLCESYGESPSSAFAAVIGARVGPNSKFERVFEDGGGGPTAIQEVEGLPRNRHIFMVPFLVNITLTPVYEKLVRATKNSLILASDQEAEIRHRDLQRRSIPGSSYEIDISGMDRSYPEAMTNAILEAVGELPLLPAITQIMATHLHHMPLMLPSVYTSGDGDDSQGAMIMTPKEGKVGRYSGIKLTSVLNSLFSLAMQLVALKRNGVIDEATEEGVLSRVHLRILGDDTLISLIDAGRQDQYNKYLASVASIGLEFGFVLEGFPGNTFLMRHRQQDGSDSAVAYRVLQQTISPENLPLDEITQEIGQAARSLGWDDLSENLTLSSEHVVSVLSAYSPRLAEITVSTDDEKKQLIRDHSIYLAEHGGEQIDWLFKFIQQNRFSLSGREVRDALPSDLISAFDALIQTRQANFYEWALSTTKFPYSY